MVSSAEINTLRHIDHTFERLYAAEQPVLTSLRQTKARFNLGHGAQGADRRATASREPVGITLRRQFRTIRLVFPWHGYGWVVCAVTELVDSAVGAENGQVRQSLTRIRE